MSQKAFLAVPAILLLAACQPADEPTDTETPEAAATPEAELLGTADLATADGTAAGTARLSATGDEVTIHVELAGLPAGTHAVHLHTTGACDAPKFESAGGHLNPEGKQHGTANPEGSHLGDLGNVEIAADGSGSIETAIRANRADALAAIFDTDGTAVMVHAGADDNMTDPSGNAGDRIACGVLTSG
jgi:Cu-Zn family superoxide dismutase